MPDDSTSTINAFKEQEKVANDLISEELDGSRSMQKSKNLTDRRRQDANRSRQAARGNRNARGRQRFSMSYRTDNDVPVVEPVSRYRSEDFSRAYLKKPLTLYSDSAQRFFERSYEVTDQNLIGLTLVLEVNADKDLVQRTEDELRKKFSDMKAKLINCINLLKKMHNEAGATDQIAGYDHKRDYELPLHTPFSSEFITCIELFDRIMARVDAAWVSGIMPTASRSELSRKWLQEMQTFARSFYTMRNNATAEAKRIRDEEAKRRAEEAKAKAEAQAKAEAEAKAQTQAKPEDQPKSEEKDAPNPVKENSVADEQSDTAPAAAPETTSEPDSQSELAEAQPDAPEPSPEAA